MVETAKNVKHVKHVKCFWDFQGLCPVSPPDVYMFNMFNISAGSSMFF